VIQIKYRPSGVGVSPNVNVSTQHIDSLVCAAEIPCHAQVLVEVARQGGIPAIGILALRMQELITAEYLRFRIVLREQREREKTHKTK